MNEQQIRRVERAVDIVRAGDKIEALGADRYRADGSKRYLVDLDHDFCTCADSGKHPELSCKHIIAVELYRVFKRRGVL